MRARLVSLLCIALFLTLSSCTFVEDSVSHPDESAVLESESTTTTTTTVIKPQDIPVLTLPTGGAWQSLATESKDSLPVGSGVGKLLTDYFTYRCNTFAKAQGIPVSDPISLSISEEVRQQEDTARLEGLRTLRRLWNCHFAGAQVLYTVERMDVAGDTAILCVYEAAYFHNWYDGYTSPEKSDLSGYGIRHVIRLRNDVILSDHYNEGRPTGVAIEGRLSDDIYWGYAGKEGAPEDLTNTPVITVDAGSYTYANTYDPSLSLAYADVWSLSRNLTRYADLHVWGGDCTNFTSQCLLYGGMPMEGNWYWNGGSGGEGGRAWKAATWLYVHLTEEFHLGRAVAMIEGIDDTGRNARYNGETVAADTLFRAGSPVFYRWKGGFPEDGEWSHVALCVGTLGDGTPAVSCHTEDRYNFKWNYGGAECNYGTVWLTADPD